MFKSVIIGVLLLCLGVTVSSGQSDDDDVVYWNYGMMETANLREKLFRDWINLAQQCEETGDLEGMLQACYIANRYIPNPQIDYQLGGLYASMGLENYVGQVGMYVDSAKACFNRAIALDSGYVAAYYGMLEVYEQTNDVDSVLALGEIMIKKDLAGNTPDLYYKMAISYAEKSDYNNADRILDNFATKTQTWYAYLLDAAINFEAGRKTDGLKALEKYFLAPERKAVELIRYMSARNLLPEEIKLAMQYADSLEQFVEDKDLMKKFSLSLLEATSYCDKFDKKEIKKIEKIAKKYIQSEAVKNVIIANLELAKGDEDDAFEKYTEYAAAGLQTMHSAVMATFRHAFPEKSREILALDPSLFVCKSRLEYRDMLGLLGEHEQDADILLAVTYNMLQSDSVFCYYFYYIGEIYGQKKNRDSAITYFAQAVECDSSNLIYKNSYAYFLALEGVQLDEALELSRSCVHEEPNSPYYLDTYGWVNFLLGNADIAIENLTKASELMPDSSEIWRHLAEVLDTKAEKAKAAVARRRADELDNKKEKEE